MAWNNILAIWLRAHKIVRHTIHNEIHISVALFPQAYTWWHTHTYTKGVTLEIRSPRDSTGVINGAQNCPKLAERYLNLRSALRLHANSR